MGKMRKSAFLLLAITAIIISTGNASAGSNGNAPQNGQDWIITRDTHVWDETVSVKDIVVNFGKTTPSGLHAPTAVSCLYFSISCVPA